MKKTIIILHGWSKEMKGGKYSELKRLLEKKNFNVYAPDLPGFNKAELTKTPMTLDDYVVFVKEFITKNNLNSVILFGHSFGGRIAAKLSSQNPKALEALIICASPLIRTRLNYKRKLVSKLSLFGKFVLKPFPPTTLQLFRKIIYFSINEWDYYKAGNLKETFLNIIKEDLKEILPKIKIKTLVVWGESDKIVPLSTGYQIANLIPHSKLVIIPKAGHKLPYENSAILTKEIVKFLE